MPSLRSPLSQLSARLLIAALVFASLPAELFAARQLPPRLLTSLSVPAAAFARVDFIHGPIHADGLGSIRRLTDEAGAITDGYSLTAFGELLSHTGSDPQPYAFAGELLDPNSGWQYHKARWYAPSTGRFTAMDPFEGLEFEPPTLHKYLYAAADAVNRVDPSGELVGAASMTTAITVAMVVQVTLVVGAAVAIAAIGALTLPAAPLSTLSRRTAPRELYAFGNKTAPYPARLEDFKLSAPGIVGPDFRRFPDGKSVLGEPELRYRKWMGVGSTCRATDP